MCGIAGVVGPGFLPERLEALRTMLWVLRHRGPDDEGIAVIPERPAPREVGVGLGCRRLSIIDLSPAGHQPMATTDGRFVLVYNGEIYNYLELRAELESLGHQFRSHSDTEVLLQAFVQWGRDALPRLMGMFALAVLDTRQRRLLLARDGFGIKPLYYASWQGGFAFASEMGALLELPGFPRKVNPQLLYDYLRTSHTDHGGETLFAGIHQVPAAHYIEVALDRLAPSVPVRYWGIDLRQQSELSWPQAVERLRALFLESIRFHLRSDVPLGFALSGGVDSSAVLLGARRVLGPGPELHAFSYIADDPAISEEVHVDAAGRAAGATLHKIHLGPSELERDIDYLVGVQGAPIPGPPIYGQHRIFQRAREAGVKVILGGQGSDELMAGYDRYVVARLASLIRQRRPGAASRFLIRAGHSPGLSTTSLALQGALTLAPRARMALDSARRKGPFPPWLDSQWFRERSVAPRLPWSPKGDNVMRELLHYTLVDAHLHALLRYEDRNAMAFSLENRVPFLTINLASLVFTLPEEFLVAPDGTRKAAFRAAMRGVVPDSVIDRRDKIGFGMPVAKWLNTSVPWVDRMLDQAGRLAGMRREPMERHWRSVQSAGARESALLLWRWIGLAAWAQRFDVVFE